MIAIGCDHGAFALKEKLKEHLTARGLEYKDLGTYSLDSCDYPDFGAAAAKAVAEGKCEKGIVVCTSGIGISIAANKIKGIRAAHVESVYDAKYTRLHNDANILCLGARVIGEGLAIELVDIFLDTEAEGGRHAARVDMIREIEAGTYNV